MRAEFTALVEPGDVDVLIHEIGLKTVVDIRRPAETRYESAPWDEHGVRWLNFPFGLGRGTAVATAGADFPGVYWATSSTIRPLSSRPSRRCSSPTTCPRCFTAPRARTGPACSARCLLDTLGVTRDVIADDYA